MRGVVAFLLLGAVVAAFASACGAGVGTSAVSDRPAGSSGASSPTAVSAAFTGDLAARAVCAGAAADMGIEGGAPPTVASAYSSTASAVAHWWRTLNGPGGPRVGAMPFDALPPGEVVDVCYFDGTFDAPGPVPIPSGFPTPLGTPWAGYHRALLALTLSGDLVGNVFGQPSSLNAADHP